MSILKKFNVCFAVNVPVYGSMVIEAESMEEAEKIAMSSYETGQVTEDEWDSKIWHEATSLVTLWSEAEDFSLLPTTESET